ncbi:MAG TPA: glutathione synthase [Ruminococcus sp.]|nr:glutathione synthase [Ruminococcus sp.]
MKQTAFYKTGCFGLERETLRVDENGELAQTLHPFPDDDKHITRDFCENQMELVTPVCHSIQEAIASIEMLDKQAKERISENHEHIWLYSNPPHFETENDIPIARWGGEFTSKQHYREALEKRYGKRLMLFSGVHFNFSFSEELLEEWYDGNGSFREFKDNLYLRLYKQIFRHSWLLVLLTSASPFYDKSLDGDNLSGIVKGKYASLRNSERGYWNQFIPILEHENLQAFTDSIQNYVDKGLLFSASELYLPVRLKPRGENSLESLAKNGVDHIELRMFDLNPLTVSGMEWNDLTFAHLLMLYLLKLPDGEFTPEQQTQAVKDHQEASLYYPEKRLISLASEILESMYQHFRDDNTACSVIEYEQNKLNGTRLCEQIQADIISR